MKYLLFADSEWGAQPQESYCGSFDTIEDACEFLAREIISESRPDWFSINYVDAYGLFKQVYYNDLSEIDIPVGMLRRPDRTDEEDYATLIEAMKKDGKL